MHNPFVITSLAAWIFTVTSF